MEIDLSSKIALCIVGVLYMLSIVYIMKENK
jgi:hypothetical protein